MTKFVIQVFFFAKRSGRIHTCPTDTNELHSMTGILHQSEDNMVLQTGTGQIKCPKFKNFEYIWQIKYANIDRKIFLILPFMETT